MRTSEAFVLGTIVGAVAVWCWGREIEGFVGERTRGGRAKAADAMRAVEEKTGQVLVTGGRNNADQSPVDTGVAAATRPVNPGQVRSPSQAKPGCLSRSRPGRLYRLRYARPVHGPEPAGRPAWAQRCSASHGAGVLP
jgi:hypothetical protein